LIYFRSKLQKLPSDKLNVMIGIRPPDLFDPRLDSMQWRGNIFWTGGQKI